MATGIGLGNWPSAGGQTSANRPWTIDATGGHPINFLDPALTHLRLHRDDWRGRRRRCRGFCWRLRLRSCFRRHSNRPTATSIHLCCASVVQRHRSRSVLPVLLVLLSPRVRNDGDRHPLEIIPGTETASDQNPGAAGSSDACGRATAAAPFTTGSRL